MNVFLTGATGKLGHALAAILASSGHSYTLLTRKPSYPSSVQGDLLRSETYSPALQGQQAVIHMAAATHSVSAVDYHRVNVLGTATLLDACRNAGVRRFIHVSTRVASPECGTYGESKAEGERLVRESGLDWTILRPSEVYSGGNKEAVERMITMLRNCPAVPYVNDSRVRLAPVHRDDVIAAIATALDRPESIGRCYLLAGPKQYTQKELLLHLRRLFDVRTLLIPIPVMLLRAVSVACSLAKLKSPPFVPDQIPRMLCQKLTDGDDAIRDLGFNPRSIEVGLMEELSPPQKT